MLLANLRETATQIANFTILASTITLTSCQSMPVDNITKWHVKVFDLNELEPVNASSFNQTLINQLIENYKNNPRDGDYSELKLSHILADTQSGRQFFIFDIQYIDDVNVVYVLDSRNSILEKFIISPWVR